MSYVHLQIAIIPITGKELHLVVMLSRNRHDQMPCFWGYGVSSGMYNSYLAMLNLICLAIVFDLDETLIVADTLWSFEDRIDALQRKIGTEVDSQRASGMAAELKRYQEDKLILKQYADNDQIFDNGKVIKAESEVVRSQSDKSHPIIRPLIRLQDRNMILTRINPNVRVSVTFGHFWLGYQMLSVDFAFYVKMNFFRLCDLSFVCIYCSMNVLLCIWLSFEIIN